MGRGRLGLGGGTAGGEDLDGEGQARPQWQHGGREQGAGEDQKRMRRRELVRGFFFSGKK